MTDEYRKCDVYVEIGGRRIKECRYWASDINKWITKNCTKKMIVNNIDLIMYNYGSKLRIIESKHSHERSSKSQLDILKLLASATIPGKEMEVYMISGDNPYDETDIYNIGKEESYHNVEKQRLIRFLNFEEEL